MVLPWRNLPRLGCGNADIKNRARTTDDEHLPSRHFRWRSVTKIFTRTKTGTRWDLGVLARAIRRSRSRLARRRRAHPLLGQADIMIHARGPRWGDRRPTAADEHAGQLFIVFATVLNHHYRDSSSHRGKFEAALRSLRRRRTRNEFAARRNTRMRQTARFGYAALAVFVHALIAGNGGWTIGAVVDSIAPQKMSGRRHHQ